jgi:alpha-beta hydrolase superfamily lysophospholipase
VICGHSLGGALATLLVADVTANTPLKPQAWTFASPQVGDAIFAAGPGLPASLPAHPSACRRRLTGKPELPPGPG